MKKRSIPYTIAVIASCAVFAGAAGSAFAAVRGYQNVRGGGGGFPGGPAPYGMMRGGIFGTVTAVQGTVITMQEIGRGGFGPAETSTAAAAVTYTVDASGATVVKDGATSTLSAVIAGDHIMVRGTVNGTTVTASSIVDGVVPGARGGGPFRGGASSTSPLFQGNGEPVVGGTVTAVNGVMFTIANSGNATYTIDASNATIVKGDVTSSVSAIAVNDRILVQGAVNGNSVTASAIVDQGPVPGAASTTAPNAPRRGFMGRLGGFFGGIGSFFHHLFGFF